VLTTLVVTPVLLAALLVASENGAAMAAVLVAIALIVSGVVFELHHPSVLVTWLHLIGALIMGCALIWVVARAVFAPGRVTYHRLVGTVLWYLMIGATFWTASALRPGEAVCGDLEGSAASSRECLLTPPHSWPHPPYRNWRPTPTATRAETAEGSPSLGRYFFIVVSTAVDSFPAAGTALFLLHAVAPLVNTATANRASSNLALISASCARK
jgi:hypothetical protein